MFSKTKNNGDCLLSFPSQDEDEEDEEENEVEDDIPHSKSVAIANKVNKKTKKREKMLQNIKKAHKKKKKKDKAPPVQLLRASYSIHRICREVVQEAGGSTKFEVKLMLLELVSRLIGTRVIN